MSRKKHAVEPKPARHSLDWIRKLRDAHYDESKDVRVTHLDPGYFDDGGLAKRLGIEVAPASRTDRLRRR